MTSGFLVGTLVGMAKTAESRTHKPSTWVPPTREKGKAFTALEINALKPGPRMYRLYGRDGLIIEGEVIREENSPPRPERLLR